MRPGTPFCPKDGPVPLPGSAGIRSRVPEGWYVWAWETLWGPGIILLQCCLLYRVTSVFAFVREAAWSLSSYGGLPIGQIDVETVSLGNSWLHGALLLRHDGVLRCRGYSWLGPL